MADHHFSGVFPILQMPFNKAGQIIFEDLRAEAEYAIRGGVHGVGIAYGSEVNKLDDHERDEVLSAVVDQVNGRIKVVMNTGAPSTVQTIHYTRVAKVLGADAVMIAPPAIIGIPTPLVRQHFIDVAESSDLPIYMQDMTGAVMSPTLLADLARANENLCYAKIETLPTPNRFTETGQLAGNKLSMFGGANGVFFIEEMRRGASGTMQGIALCDIVRKTWDHFQAGEEIAAESLWNHYQPLVKLYTLGEGQLYWIAKEILKRRGIFSEAYPRLPAVKPDVGIFSELDSLIERLGVAPI
ncbi:MAG: dihydrodipicolinate synthase family protein [Chloroflexi bacterium]|nr:dihydrodipicolinate synthase family protein [Chloroflexota bacterium]